MEDFFDLLFRTDREIFEIIFEETSRQDGILELIASENFASEAVLLTMASPMNNKYAEGYPSRRYYGGCEFMDKAEELARNMAKQLFSAEYANVQPHSGTQANMGVYFAMLDVGDTILSMELSHGGHLSHGSPVSFTGKFYNIVYYRVNPDTELIDFDSVSRLAKEYRPKLILCGYSAYPRQIEFDKFREIADSVGAFLLADIAHIAGLVAVGLHPSPVPYAEFVTSTTHKTLRGPRGGFILTREEYAKRIDKGVFPCMQGGPFMHIIAAKAVCFKEAQTEEFKRYQGQILKNAKRLAETLKESGLRLVSGGTDNHLMLVDLRPIGITGKVAESALERAGITVNKNTIPFDPEKPTVTSGIRIGVPAVTTRGMKEEEMVKIGKWIGSILKAPDDDNVIKRVRGEVQELTAQFPLYKTRREIMQKWLSLVSNK